MFFNTPLSDCDRSGDCGGWCPLVLLCPVWSGCLWRVLFCRVACNPMPPGMPAAPKAEGHPASTPSSTLGPEGGGGSPLADPGGLSPGICRPWLGRPSLRGERALGRSDRSIGCAPNKGHPEREGAEPLGGTSALGQCLTNPPISGEVAPKPRWAGPKYRCPTARARDISVRAR